MVNSTLAPATTCHAFNFTVPRYDNLASASNASLTTPAAHVTYGTPHSYASPITTTDDQTDQSRTRENVRTLTSAAVINFYGVTLTVWTHADSTRTAMLKAVKARSKQTRSGFGSLRSDPVVLPRSATTADNGTRRRDPLPWTMGGTASETDFTGTETETGLSESDPETTNRRGPRGIYGKMPSAVDSILEETAAVLDDAGDVYWMPYAITLGKYAECHLWPH